MLCLVSHNHSILVLKDLVGAIIGRGGGTIKTITQETHAKVDVHRKEYSSTNENVIMIYGTPDACSSACKRLLQVMQDESRALNRPDEVVLKILATNAFIGRIIGKNGATIKKIMTNTDAKISVNRSVQRQRWHRLPPGGYEHPFFLTYLLLNYFFSPLSLSLSPSTVQILFLSSTTSEQFSFPAHSRQCHRRKVPSVQS